MARAEGDSHLEGLVSLEGQAQGQTQDLEKQQPGRPK